ncbi:MAG TPA: N-methyl-L-tryptophan oxidase [Anaerolineales bacterium]|nr:N-methyl-L-tryptophan oxidase [Anaerolineales bacterium]
MNPIPKHYNSIVIGVGAMGSATCYELAKRGKRVLGLEQFDIPNDQGSSYGYTRIIRLAYYEHPSYVSLLHRAYQLFEEIERRSGEKILYKVGSIDAGPADSWVFKGSFQSCVDYDIPHEVLTGKEMSERFPGYQLPHSIMALYQKDGGFLTPERTIVSYVQTAQALGAEIHARETVLGWEPLGDGVRVTTNRDVYTADSLVFTAGSWNASLQPWLQGLAVPERQVLAWLQPQRPEFFRTDNFPVFNCLVDEGRFYGFPAFSVPGFKFAKYHHFEETGLPEHLSRIPTDTDERMLREFANRYFPNATGPTMTLKTCMFTNAPDGHFIIDLHPEFPQVSFASACSGHGFKFTSVIGEIMADLAERQTCRHDLSLFALSRFNGKVSSLHTSKFNLVQHGLPNVGGHDPFGGGHNQGGGATRSTLSRPLQTSHGYATDGQDTANPRYWNRDAVKSWW